MKYFGTDGIRQKAEKFDLAFVANVVAGLVDYAGNQIKVMIGGDTRESTEWILRDLETALETFGVEYGNVGVLPTPAINYCFYEMGFDFAIDVTASHNPYTDNGIKIFERGFNGGRKLCEQGCERIEQALASPKDFTPVSPSLRESLHDDAVELYSRHLASYLGECSLAGLRIGMDCANGATSVINKSIFAGLGAEVMLINCDASYGTKINQDCGSTHLESLQRLVVDNQLSFGVAFDGDGDRCLLVDQNGDVVDGDQIIAIIASYLRLDKIVVTVMANQGLLNWANANNVFVETTAVGDTNVKLAMDGKHIQIGGEQSGHVILPGEATGDGMLTGLMVAKIVAQSGKTLHELAGIFVKSPQVIVNLPVSPEQKANFEASDAVKRLLLEYEQKLATQNGRLLVRPSGTENLIRITVWGDDGDAIAMMASGLKGKLERIL